MQEKISSRWIFPRLARTELAIGELEGAADGLNVGIEEHHQDNTKKDREGHLRHIALRHAHSDSFSSTCRRSLCMYGISA